MIKEFLIINRDKLEFGLKWSSIIFISLVLVAFAWGRYHGQIPEWSLFITVLLVAGIFFPVFCMTLGTIKEFQEYKITKRTLDQYPFNELTKNGFEIILTNKKSKWMFSQIMLRGHIDDYPMDCEVENGIIKLIALVNRDNFKKEHMKELKREFGDRKVEYDWLGIALRFNIKKEKFTSFGQLKADIHRFIQFFKKNELKSWENPWN